MKILHVYEAWHADLNDEIDRHVADLARGLTVRGHDVHALNPLSPADPRFGNDIAAVGRARGAAICYGDSRRNSFGAVVRYMRRNGPFDIVHAHGSGVGAVTRAAALLSTAGVIYTPYTVILGKGTSLGNRLGHSRTSVAFGSFLERFLSRFTSRIVCSSSIEYEHLTDVLRIAEHRLVLLHLGLSPDGFRRQSNLHAELGLPPEAKLVGFVGRLSPHKGADVALRALQAVRAARTDTHLIVIGTGPEETGLRALAGFLGVAPAVHWLGHGPARAHYRNFKVLVYPSRHGDIAYPLLEALYCGIPVVASSVAAPHELVSPGLNGFLVPPDDPEALAQQIIALLADDRLPTRNAAGARKLRAYLELDRMLDELEEIYFGRLAGRRPFPAGLHGDAEREIMTSTIG